MAKKEKLRRWELARLLGVAVAALVCSGLGKEQDSLADKVIRLHVVANSDDPADQAVKLKVRDAVLEESAPLLEGLSREQGLEALEAALPQIGQAAADTLAENGYSYPVRVSLRDDWFPTKSYTDFALPAGSYTALRVELGEGEGQNWWCVVFPPLCLGSVSETANAALAGGLDGEELALITGETEGYVVKFKAMELWEQFKANFR